MDQNLDLHFYIYLSIYLSISISISISSYLYISTYLSIYLHPCRCLSIHYLVYKLDVFHSPFAVASFFYRPNIVLEEHIGAGKLSQRWEREDVWMGV